MKKLFVLLSAVLLFAALAVASSAHSTYIVENDPVELAGSTPTVDGTIADNEGWSAAARLDNDTAGFFWDFFPMTAEADLYFAVDDDNLYFAAVISALPIDGGEGRENLINGFIASDDFDYGYTEKQGTDTFFTYGWNGDVITLMLDPGRKLAENDPNGFAPWYNIGLFYDDLSNTASVRVYRSKVNSDEITDDVSAAGAVTADGWTVELAIPLEIIAKDVSDISDGAVEMTAETLKGEVETAASVMYMDRYFNTAKDKVDTWGRFIVVCNKCADGTPGQMTSGVGVKAMGLTLFNDLGHDFGEWTADPVTDCLEPGTESRVCSICEKTQTRKVAAIGKHDFGDWAPDPVEDCLKPTSQSRVCAVCGKTQTKYGQAIGKHTFGDWTDEVLSTIGANGTRIRVCEVCKTVERENTPMLLMPDDVKEDAWYTEAVVYCINHRYMYGVREDPLSPGGVFSPDMAVTRAMIVTILSKIDGADVSTYEGSHFTDVPEGRWYTKPVEWAYGEGFAAGTGNGKFAPDAPVTRESLVQFLYTYSSKRGCDVTHGERLGNYEDYLTVSGWAETAMEWAVGAGLISSTSPGSLVLSPKATATRAQVALIVYKYMNWLEDHK